tara:strand:- start:3213 stop:3698 length:486 start_codon:yes stop_codon:yes gene_type:complete
MYPKRYVPKALSSSDKKLQKNEISKSKRQYKKNEYYTRRKVESFKSRESKHIINAKEIYKIKKVNLSKELSRRTGCSRKVLSEIMRKGQGAYYSSGSRPNQTAHSWGKARLASAITGGKAAALEYNLLKKGCKKTSKALRLAEKAKKVHKSGTRRVPKTLK